MAGALSSKLHVPGGILWVMLAQTKKDFAMSTANAEHANTTHPDKVHALKHEAMDAVKQKVTERPTTIFGRVKQGVAGLGFGGIGAVVGLAATFVATNFTVVKTVVNTWRENGYFDGDKVDAALKNSGANKLVLVPALVGAAVLGAVGAYFGAKKQAAHDKRWALGKDAPGVIEKQQNYSKALEETLKSKETELAEVKEERGNLRAANENIKQIIAEGARDFRQHAEKETSAEVTR